VSLAWWAELVGGWPSAKQSPIAQLLFGDPTRPSGLTADGEPLYPLGLNIVRYNIGASGPGAQCKLAFRPGAAVPTVLDPSAGGHPNLSLDSNQIGILRLAQTLIGERHGAKAYVEAFANSPPWWLLGNKCPQGDGTATVLADSNQALQYASYLAEVINAFRKQGIQFTSVDPVNEPSIGWSCSQTNTCQEGAFISDDATQSAPITRSALTDVLQDACDAMGPRGIPVSAPDGNSPDDTLSFVDKDLGGLPCVSQLNTHSYQNGAQPYVGSNRETLSKAVRGGGRALWMSEFGNGAGSCNGSGIASQNAACTGIGLATQVADDLNGLAPQAWVYWTAMEGPGGWGLFTDSTYPAMGQQAPPATLGQELTPSARFWALGQYTRFIPGGSKIVPVSSPAPGDVRIAVAEIGAHDITVVATNPSTDEQPLSIDLSPLNAVDGRPTVYRTDPGEHMRLLQGAAANVAGGSLSDRLPPESISTYLIGPSTSAHAGQPLHRHHHSPVNGQQGVTVDGITLRDAGAAFPGIGATYSAFATAHQRPLTGEQPPYGAFDSVDQFRSTFNNVQSIECPAVGVETDCILHILIYFPRFIPLAVAQQLARSQLPADATPIGEFTEDYINKNNPEGECHIYKSASLAQRMGSDGRIYVYYTSSFGPYEPTGTYSYSPQRVSYAVLDAPGGHGPFPEYPCGNAN
jgi:hypothetical protein